MVKKTGLGRGLSALIPGDEDTLVEKGVLSVPLDYISPNPRQPRSVEGVEALQELTASVKEHGVLQPLIVTRSETPDRYILIAGERRLHAAKSAGLTEIPVIIREASDQERLELAIIENVQRADLSPLEEAEAYRQLAEDFHLSHEAIATQVGKNRVTVTNTLRLLKLPDSIKNALIEGRIAEGHARALLALPTTEGQTAALRSILSQELNVRRTEELVRKLCGEKPTAPPRKPVLPELTAIEERLRNSLGTKVNLRSNKKGGTITIHYYSQEELETLLTRFLEA